jgi:tRNA (guanine-N7-)-methyltransferase
MPRRKHKDKRMPFTDKDRKLDSTSLPWPTDWAELFGAARPLIVEIGFGYGHFLQHLHRAHPDANIIGLEVNHSCLVKVEKAIQRKQMDNVRVIRSTAETALHHLFTPGSISQIHINFPDPWFKEKHAGRRLMQRDTLDAMANRLTADGRLYLATDIRAYAEMASELLESTLCLSNLFDTPWIYEMPGRIITKYERKAKQAGRPCHYLAYQRNTQNPPQIPVMEECDMPHLVIQTPLDLPTLLEKANLSQLVAQSFEFGEVHISFKDAYLGDRSLLFDIYIYEPTIEQRVALILVQREGKADEYTLKLGLIGSPRPTDGVHHAVRVLGGWLVNVHPENKLLDSKVRGG